MTFEELAANAGRAAAAVGARTKVPPFGAVLEIRRRATIAAWVTVATVLVSLVGAALLLSARVPSPEPVTPPPPITSIPAPEVIDTLAACPVTQPGDEPFTPANAAPDGPPENFEAVWYGSPELWTYVGQQGEVWEALPVADDGTLTQKTFWWREGYSMSEESMPAIGVVVEPVDRSGPPVEFGSPGTSGSNPEIGQFMLVGISIPGEGCWQITGKYRGSSLSYVVWVGDTE